MSAGSSPDASPIRAGDTAPAGAVGPDSTLTDGAELGADEWRQFKEVWFAVQDGSPDERQRLLDDPSLPLRVREQVERMLLMAPRVGTRFDEPAHLSLGLDRDPFDATMQPTLVGQRLGPYRVMRLIGRGGMGAVYEAERDDAQYRQRVAIKTLWRGADSEILLQRFRSERQILAALQHPQIAQLIDGGATESGMPWLAMEYVDGVSIDQYCDDHALTIPARIDLLRQVCRAVHHAHQRLVVHRDLKPSNVMVTADGAVKLLDFGVAKLLDDSDGGGTLTAAGLSPFTAAYAAPEQATAGETASTATDVYALGALLVTLLAGAPPLDLQGLDGVTRLLAVRDRTPRAPSVVALEQSGAAATVRGVESVKRLSSALRGELDAIALKALRRDPARRYASVQALSDDLHRYLRRDRVLARPDTVTYRLWTFTRRHRALVFGTACAVFAVLATGMVALRQARIMRDEAARAERVAAFMSAMVTGAGGVSREPTIRIGPGRTVAQLLDSAVPRVPRDFADDPRVRSRLYTALGVNYASQARYTTAHALLDSARTLAAASYGRRSVEYANASLELASLELGFHGPDAADEPLEAATVTTSRGADFDALRTRVLLLRARQYLGRGHIRVADSLARIVLDAERQRGGITTLVATAEDVRVSATAWLLRDPRDYLTRARRLRRLTDSLGMQLSGERDHAETSEIEALLVLGRADEAERRIQSNIERLQLAFGDQLLVQIEANKVNALLASVRGDSATRREFLARGWALMDRAADVPASQRLLFSNAYIDDALARGAAVDALHAAEQTRRVLAESESAMPMVFAHLYVGLARLANNDAPGAEQALREGIETVKDLPDLASMRPRLRRPLAVALAAQGKSAQADSVRQLDPPKAAVPPCTPGGEWRGCDE